MEAAVGFFYRGVTSEALGRLDDARRDYESAMAVHDALGSTTESARLNALQHLASLQCRQGMVDRGRASADLGLGVLDHANADHKTWIERFEKTRAGCGG
jgi:hypothetical protein